MTIFHLKMGILCSWVVEKSWRETVGENSSYRFLVAILGTTEIDINFLTIPLINYKSNFRNTAMICDGSLGQMFDSTQQTSHALADPCLPNLPRMQGFLDVGDASRSSRVWQRNACEKYWTRMLVEDRHQFCVQNGFTNCNTYPELELLLWSRVNLNPMNSNYI